ncbi:MAG: hypothetical protein J5925_03520 [Clostridia bacterium]|nr:hypothetical protein [Clostridia bacterium]
MKKKYSSSGRLAAVLATLLLVCAVLAACSNVSGITELDPEQFNLGTSSVAVEESSEDVPTPDGYTEAPTVDQMVNITPSTVAVYGHCEPDSVIRVKGNGTESETESYGDYYVICAEISGSRSLLEITAQAEGKQESLPRQFVAEYNATADKRLDGNSVSVGSGSRLYFDKYADSAEGKNLYTASELVKIREYITNTITAYVFDRAKGQDAELIICLIPSSTTVYGEIFPEEGLEYANTTIYDQILNAVKGTRATLIDMREEFLALRDEEETKEYGGLYRITDSALSDYGAYLTYKAIMDKVAVRFPEALPRDISEFNIETIKGVKGGNLVACRGFDATKFTEDIVKFTPKFTLQLGSNSASTSSIIALRKYVDKDNKDFNYFTKNDSRDNINGIAERWTIDTARSEKATLPAALIYRDYASYSFSDILAERFEKCLLARGGDFAINISNVKQYTREGQTVCDYVILILSEESFEFAFSLALTD